jgi:threonine 3-dehydrogenase
MKALAKLERAPGLTLTDVKVPEVGHNDVMIRIKRTAICGTDIHIWKWDDWAQNTIPVPMHVGHEYVGEIVEMGAEVRGFSIGDRVSGEGHITCGFCRNCRAGRRHLCRNTVGVGVNREGAFAEYLVIPAFNAFKIPPEISDDLAAIFDPFGNATHTALSFNLVGEDVLITGAGPIGIMAVAIAKHVGARNVVITDINDYRLGLARKMGATRAVNVSRESLRDVMADLHMAEGFDVGLEMSGVPGAFTGMLEAMNHGGKIALLGIPPAQTAIDWNQVIFKGLEIKGIYGREMFETWYKMVAMLQSGLDLSPILTHHFKVDDYQQAFATMLSGESGKVILDWTSAKHTRGAMRAASDTPAACSSACGRFVELGLNAHVNVVADRWIPCREPKLRAADMPFCGKTQRVFFR